MQQSRQTTPEIPHLFVTLPPVKPGYISPACGFAALYGLSSQGKTIQNKVRPPRGTPVDSERFRRAVNVRKKRCADKYCRLDCQSLYPICHSHPAYRTRTCGGGGHLHSEALLH